MEFFADRVTPLQQHSAQPPMRALRMILDFTPEFQDPGCGSTISSCPSCVTQPPRAEENFFFDEYAEDRA